VAENGTGWIHPQLATLVERPVYILCIIILVIFGVFLAAKSPVRQDVVPASKKPDKDAALVVIHRGVFAR